MMKRGLLSFGMFMLFLTLVACDNQQDNVTPVKNDGTSDEEEIAIDSDNQENNDEDTENDNSPADEGEVTDDDPAADMKSKMDELDYDEFELEVDYGPDSEYEVEIEKDNNRIESEVEDELNGEYLEGQDAFDNIYPKVKKLTIDQSTNKEEAIEQVLEAFDLNTDYTEIEIEITFKDGTKIEFED